MRVTTLVFKDIFHVSSIHEKLKFILCCLPKKKRASLFNFIIIDPPNKINMQIAPRL
jgi:hypothetical protein